ncbi:sulfotransferase [Aquibium sp. LZ166]|uniref:Sulfotransferase n=1 Tax=Aquibium pacificus TaxID=3153579 RepID=A0ABV3SDY8_9HYPH
MRSSASTTVILIGCSRSGTTLLSNLLNQSPDVFIAPETKFFERTYAQRHWLRLLPKATQDASVVRRLLRDQYPKLPPVFAEHEDCIARKFAERRDIPGAFFDILDCLSDARVVGEKTPWHTVFCDVMVNANPGTRFVAIVRDAPAVVASLYQRPRFARVATITQCAARWLILNDMILGLQKSLGPDRLALVRYEDLITDPRATIDRLCGFLGIEFAETMLRPTFQDSSLKGGGPVQGETELDAGALDRWRERLTPAQIDLILALTGEMRARLGYAPAGTSAPMVERLRLAAETVVQRAGIALMRSGFYPVGPFTDSVMENVPARFARATSGRP